MKSTKPENESVALLNARSPLKRRGVLMGAGATGAAVVVAQIVGRDMAASAAPVTALTASATGAAGYQFTAHVARYYETAKI